MISAFFGTFGRIEAAHAALVLTDAHAALAQPVSLIRFTLPAEAGLPPRIVTADPVRVIERTAGSAHGCTAPVITEIAKAREDGRCAVLDLPVAWLADTTLRKSLDAAVLTVGPAPLDEHAACHVLSTEGAVPLDPAVGGIAPAWLLGCSRGGGGPAGTAFGRTMARLAADLAADLAGEVPVRTLPVTLPPLTHSEASHLVVGGRSARTLSAGIWLLAALRAVASDPQAASIDADRLAAALGVDTGIVRLMDERRTGERLRDLADALDAIRDGTGPARSELDDSPRLEDWRVEAAPVRILTGRVYGHPNIVDGRRVSTSALYATDSVSYARTLSRTYTLGRPAGREAGSGLH
ncbi:MULTISPECIES: hypothetical protein [unclassified Methylobacterium]|uniref:hypothetical protein n=1 Tax=unclassified Methylobacterium TaxID=2615210 RepID=UPI0006FED269|nr:MULTISPECIES: hypothetical protein [unclassified Methylobacterium]KQO59649.1 hypothetical protein ASF22_08415 [Methylobacterium sp. Leaf87]KQP60939.1 hypothetical protein ASF52_07370 [Methylobacterium sp. Leaf112]